MTTALTGSLPAVSPFDLRKSVEFLRGFGACRGEQVLTEDTITKAVALDGQPIAFRVSPSEAGVDYLLHSDTPISPATHDRVRLLIDRYLSLSDDLGEFYALAETDDPAYARLVERQHGLHHVRFLTLAEVAVWAVLTQRSPKNVALAAKHRLVDELGRTITFDGVRHRTFPELTDLHRLTEADFLPLVRNARKAEYLVALVAGLLDLGEDHLRTAPDAASALLGIRGVGEFSTALILLRGLGRMDSVPLHLPNFARTTAALYGPGNHDETLRSHYGKHLGHWSYYLNVGLPAHAG